MRSSHLKLACALSVISFVLGICCVVSAKESDATKADSYLNIGEKGLKIFKSMMPKKETIKKETNAVFIDATKIDIDYYTNLSKGLKLEIFFLKKSYFKGEEDPLINKLIEQMPQIRESSCKEVVGYHVYQLLAKDVFTDQIAIQPSKGLVCFIVLCDDKIMHSQSLAWEGSKNGAIHIQFIGRDMYVQYGS
jgi:hypothetical protein